MNSSALQRSNQRAAVTGKAAFAPELPALCDPLQEGISSSLDNLFPGCRRAASGMQEWGKHPRKHREVVSHALSSSGGLGDGTLGYRSAVPADSCLDSACALPGNKV